MSILCIVIGVIGLVGFTGAGYIATDKLMSSQTIVSLFSLNVTAQWIIVGICFLIGLLFCLNWVMLGLNCKNIKKLQRRRKKKEKQQDA